MTTLLVRNARIVRVDHGRTEPAASDILIENGLLSRLVPAGSYAGTPAATLDARGRFALPGLIDCHCHTCGVLQPTVPSPTALAWIPRQIRLNLTAHLRAGVTTVRDMTAPLRLSLWLKRLSRNPASGLPRLLCSGPMLTVPGGYPGHLPRDLAWMRLLTGPLRPPESSRSCRYIARSLWLIIHWLLRNRS